MSFNIIVLAKQVPDTRNVGKDAMLLGVKKTTFQIECRFFCHNQFYFLFVPSFFFLVNDPFLLPNFLWFRAFASGLKSGASPNSGGMQEYPVIVNTTPVGTFPHTAECPDVPYCFIGKEHLLFDAIYNPAETLFLSKGKEAGATCVNGLQMLIGQAEAAWKIWNS